MGVLPQVINLLEFNGASTPEDSSVATKSTDNSGNFRHDIDPNFIQKGFKSLDNPVLRGFFTLVLNEE